VRGIACPAKVAVPAAVTSWVAGTVVVLVKVTSTAGACSSVSGLVTVSD
jgi:hypothetical protein